MKERILLVGENSALLSTRAMLLSEWQTATANSSEASNILRTNSFDGIVLCHTVGTNEANGLIAQANESSPLPAILSIRRPGDPELLGAVHHQSDLWESPAWFSATITALMGERNIAL